MGDVTPDMGREWLLAAFRQDLIALGIHPGSLAVFERQVRADERDRIERRHFRSRTTWAASRRWRRWRHRYLLPVASLLPGHVLARLHRVWKLDYDHSDGWSFWMDASYHGWARRNRSRG